MRSRFEYRAMDCLGARRNHSNRIRTAKTDNRNRSPSFEGSGAGKSMKIFWTIIFAATLLTGCATYHSQPVSPEKTANAFDARSLANADLKTFLETNHVTAEIWNLNALTLVAFYY